MGNRSERRTMGRLMIFSVLLVETLSAPNRCIETCTLNHGSDSYHSQRAGHSYVNHESSTQGIVGNQNYPDLENSKPGNWSEHDQHKTDDGHGIVHEERGQYVQGPTKTRYYNKNYTAAYASVNGVPVDTENVFQTHEGFGSVSISEIERKVQENLRNLESIHKQSHSELHNAHSVLENANAMNQRHENYGTYNRAGSQTAYERMNHNHESRPGNWTEVNSYKTDGGHGQVYEEQGQRVIGPKTVKYYNKNYSSSYNSRVNAPSSADINQQIQNMHQQFDNLETQFHSTAQGGYGKKTENSEVKYNSYTPSNTNSHYTRQRDRSYLESANQLEETSKTAHQEINQQSNSRGVHDEIHTNVDSGNHKVAQGLYVIPSSMSFSTTNQPFHKREEFHHSQSSHSSYQVREQTNVQPNLVHVPLTKNNYQEHEYVSNQNSMSASKRAELQKLHQSMSSSNHEFNTQNLYGQNIINHPPAQQTQDSQYEHHWSASSHTKSDGAVPIRYNTNVPNDRWNSESVNSHHSGHLTTEGIQRHNTYVGETRKHDYNAQYTLVPGSMNIGVFDLGQMTQGPECTQKTEQMQYGSNHDTRYKRNADPYRQGEPTRRLRDWEQDMQQQSQFEDWTQTSGKFDHQKYQQSGEDLTQKTSADDWISSYGPQKTSRDYQEYEDITQQTQDLYNPQKVIPQQYGKSFTQQAEGAFELGYPHKPPTSIVSYKEEEDLIQQTSGHSEFGQKNYKLPKPKTGYPEYEDLTQQTQDRFESPKVGNQQRDEDFTQQTVGKYEFGQQDSYKPPKSMGGYSEYEDWTQQTQGVYRPKVGNQDRGKDFTQQNIGTLEFGPHLVYNPPKSTNNDQEYEDLKQQTRDVYAPLKVSNQQHGEDFTQQIEGNFEFGQHFNNEDLTQKTSSQLHFGQQTYDSWKPHKLGGSCQESETCEDSTQQIYQPLKVSNEPQDDLIQQTSKNFGFGHQSTGIDNPAEIGYQQPENKTEPQIVASLEVEKQLKQTTSNPSKLSVQQQQEFGRELTHQTLNTNFQFGPEARGTNESSTLKIEDLTPEQDKNRNFKNFSQQSSTEKLETSNDENTTTQQTGGFRGFFNKALGKLGINTSNQQSTSIFESENHHAHSENQSMHEMNHFSHGSSYNVAYGQQSHRSHESRHEFSTSSSSSSSSNSSSYRKTENFSENDEHSTQTGHFEHVASEGFATHSQQHASDNSNQQTSGQLESGQEAQQSTLSQQGEILHQRGYKQNEDQTSGQQIPERQNEDLTEKTGEFEQQVSVESEFERDTHHGIPLENLTEKPERFNQQTSGQFEFGQQHQHVQQNGDSTQNTGEFDQKISSQFGFGQTEYSKQNEDLTQITGGFESMRPVDQSQLNVENQKLEVSSTQQNAESNGWIGELDKIRTTNIERGQQSQQQTSDHLEFGHQTQEVSQSPVTFHPMILKPAPKQKPRPRYSQQQPINLDNTYKPFEVTAEANKEIDGEINRGDQGIPSMDQTNKLAPTYKMGQQTNIEQPSQTGTNGENSYVAQKQSSYAGVKGKARSGAQWHYNHHPGDLTNIEGGYHSSYDKMRQGMENQQPNPSSSLQSRQQMETNEDKEKVQIFSRGVNMKPRILEAYGGGPYDASHDDDILNAVTVNPSATLPPYADGRDSWDIREKTAEITPLTTDQNPPSSTYSIESNSQTEAPPSFWNRLGNKVSSTLGKAKEKAKDIFG